MMNERPPELELNVVKEYKEDFLEKNEHALESFMERYNAGKKLFNDGGQNARIFSYVHDKYGSLLAKEKRNGVVSGFAQNSSSMELEYQDELYHKYNIPCPEPLALIEQTQRDYVNKRMIITEIILMKKIDGYSVGDHYRDEFARLELPENFSVELFMEELTQHINTMHKHGIYHNDLTMNNVIINEEGRPVLIDFGTTRTSFGEDPYEAPETVVTINGIRSIQKAARFVPDEDNLETIKMGLRQIIEQHRR